ncbi:MAG: NUDIX domain-containing protein [Planctomycetota bacterium]
MAKHIEFIARGVLQHGHRLLLCRNAKHGYTYLPGGHVEFGETAAEALAREFREETGLDVRVGSCGLVCEQTFEQGGKQRHEVSVVFHVEPVDLQIDAAGHPATVESLEPKIAFDWVDLAALVDADLRPTAIKAWLTSGAASTEWVSVRE